MPPNYKIGRRYNVTVEGATAVDVVREGSDTLLYLQFASGHRFGPIPADDHRVAVTHVPPSSWPPEVGDTWDGDGHRWFAIAIRDPEGEPAGTRLVNENDRCPHGVYGGDAYCYEDAAVLLAHASDLRLIARKGWPPPQTEAPHPDFTDEPPF